MDECQVAAASTLRQYADALSSATTTCLMPHLIWLPGVSNRRITTVDQQVGAGYEARGVARKIERGAADLFGLSETADRMLRDRQGARLGHAAVSERDAFGLHGTRRQRIDADVVAGVIDGH